MMDGLILEIFFNIHSFEYKFGHESWCRSETECVNMIEQTATHRLEAYIYSVLASTNVHYISVQRNLFVHELICYRSSLLYYITAYLDLMWVSGSCIKICVMHYACVSPQLCNDPQRRGAWWVGS